MKSEIKRNAERSFKDFLKSWDNIMIPNLRHCGRVQLVMKTWEKVHGGLFIWIYVSPTLACDGVRLSSHCSPCWFFLQRQEAKIGQWVVCVPGLSNRRYPRLPFGQTAAKKRFLLLDTLRLVHTILLKQFIDKMKNLLKLVIWGRKLQNICIRTSVTWLCFYVSSHH